MKYHYEDIINGLNNNQIENVYFSIDGYSHYNNCLIKRCSNALIHNKYVFKVEMSLTNDNSEISIYYQKFHGDEKLFKIKGKGVFSLKQIWNKVIITKINYFKDS